MPSFQVKILQPHWLSSEILELSCEKPFDYLPGQYIFIEHQGQRHPFSIASAPFESTLRFHMQHSERRPMQENVWHLIKQGEMLTLSQPTGDAYLRSDSTRPLLFIAGGSGFAPIASMINALANQHSPRIIHLYWGAEQHQFLYDLKRLEQWQSELPHFKWTPVLSHDLESETRHGLVHQAVLEDQLALPDFDIYIAGPFALSKTAHADFSKQFGPGLKMYSDALTNTN